jgi:hypothetical protein
LKTTLLEKLVAVYGTREAAVEIVDLYADGSLSETMNRQLLQLAAKDQDLQLELSTLKETVDTLHDDPAPLFTEETSQRILSKLLNRGVVGLQPETNAAFWQYHLPIQG